MDSTAVLHRCFSAPPPPHDLPTTPSVVLGRQPLSLLSFRCNVSSAHLLLNKSNDNYNNKYGRLNKNNNSIDVQCCRVTKPTSRSNDGGNFPVANARLALQSLLCFSYPKKDVEHTDFINMQKKEALQALLEQNPKKAWEKINVVDKKYKKNPKQHIQYEAKMAIIQILIHMGTVESWQKASDKYFEVTNMKDKPSDATILLYAAVIRTLLGHNKRDIVDAWQNYVNTISSDPTMRRG